MAAEIGSVDPEQGENQRAGTAATLQEVTCLWQEAFLFFCGGNCPYLYSNRCFLNGVVRYSCLEALLLTATATCGGVGVGEGFGMVLVY